MKYSISATVNYPYDEEIETPIKQNASLNDIYKWIVQLLETEQALTSCVIIIAKEPRQ